MLWAILQEAKGKIISLYLIALRNGIYRLNLQNYFVNPELGRGIEFGPNSPPRVREPSELRTDDLIFLADQDQADRCGNHNDQNAGQ